MLDDNGNDYCDMQYYSGLFDKRKAREAFYQADYIKSYELMYGKKLDESDAIIYNKAKTILEMKRKLTPTIIIWAWEKKYRRWMLSCQGGTLSRNIG